MKPRYKHVEDIIEDLWGYCMELEDEYHRTGDNATILKFAVAIVTLQYWEDVMLNMEGFDVFEVHF